MSIINNWRNPLDFPSAGKQVIVNTLSQGPLVGFCEISCTQPHWMVYYPQKNTNPQKYSEQYADVDVIGWKYIE